jgi:hypothetical protein
LHEFITTTYCVCIRWMPVVGMVTALNEPNLGIRIYPQLGAVVEINGSIYTLAVHTDCKQLLVLRSKQLQPIPAEPSEKYDLKPGFEP